VPPARGRPARPRTFRGRVRCGNRSPYRSGRRTRGGAVPRPAGWRSCNGTIVARHHGRPGSRPDLMPMGTACETSRMDTTNPADGPAFVHPTAEIEAGAQVGAGTTV